MEKFPVARAGRKRRPVQVMEFVDPFDKRQRKTKQHRVGKFGANEDGKLEKGVESLKQSEIFQQVMDLGSTQLGKKEKKRYENERLAELGCKAKAPEKVPYKIMQSMKKVHAKRQEKVDREAVEAGIVRVKTGKKRRNNKK